MLNIQAGLIVKSSETDPVTGERHHLVQGITTAAATWLSAAVGIACGGGMYFTAAFSTALNLLLLRFGPRGDYTADDRSVPSRLNEQEWGAFDGKDEELGKAKSAYGGMEEIQPINDKPNRSLSTRSLRSRPSLAAC